ncbi:MAG: MFS transporter [Candidatus Azobacteroides sp.]|nr:MFS transporter [Candidatus Azobacteroides sp.]
MKKRKAFIQLSLMMFMQYFIFAVWWVPFAAYLGNTMTMIQATLILCSMAIGAMASPFIGLIADKRFASQKVLATLNLLTAIFLFISIYQTSFAGKLISILLVMLCYMPTQSLTSSIAMTHAPAELFPRVRLMGTIGWVASGIFSLLALRVLKMESFDGTIYPLYCGVAAGLLAALLNLFLPNTPPVGDRTEKISIKDVLGLRTLSILKNRNFNIFVLLSVLAIIPFTLYHLFGSLIFADKDVKYITLTMNSGQIAEILFLFLTTGILVKYGIKKALLFGLAAMLIRYGAFWYGAVFEQQWLYGYGVGIIVHGLIFGLFFVGGQVYADKIAPASLRGQVQGFLFFIIWGVGYLVGTLFNGILIDSFRSAEGCDWPVLFGVQTVFSLVIIVLFILLFKPDQKPK